MGGFTTHAKPFSLGFLLWGDAGFHEPLVLVTAFGNVNKRAFVFPYITRSPG
jgi:hypothetical protein